jgi:hypothetical protein
VGATTVPGHCSHNPCSRSIALQPTLALCTNQSHHIGQDTHRHREVGVRAACAASCMLLPPRQFVRRARLPNCPLTPPCRSYVDRRV